MKCGTTGDCVEQARRHDVEMGVKLRSINLVTRECDDRFDARAATVADGQGGEELILLEGQDADSSSELTAYSNLGLCKPGDEALRFRSGATALGGRIQVNGAGQGVVVR